MEKEIGIYIHIPFCISKCYYCDFTSFINNEDKIEKYINALCNEILQNAEILSEYKIKTIYFGGGTPSYIDVRYIKKIIDTLKLFTNCDDEEYFSEVTIEVNPNSIDEEKIEIYKEIGINRISIGLQSANDEVLKNIGRKHTFEEFVNVLKICRDKELSNISVDLIYPLPGLDIIKFKDSLNAVVNLSIEYDVKHISIYNLEVHENTKLDFLLKESFLTLAHEDEEYEMKCYLEDTLIKNGYNKYEISNFAFKRF